jgi:ABC-type dipeptide/oligopeptide/nickel transport system ATPase component
MLITGSTGSGKSVLQRSIIGHVSRFADKFQMLICDMKQVEFSMFNNIDGIVSISKDVNEVERMLKTVKETMYARFVAMESHEATSIYQLEGETVPFVKINNNDYPEDFIFNVENDGVKTVMNAKQIYTLMNHSVFID